MISGVTSSRRALIASMFTSFAAILFSAYFHSGGFNAPYTDILSFFQRDWVAAGQIPYTPGAFLEYPPVSGMILYASRVLGGFIAGSAGGIYAGYYDSFSLLSLFAAVGIAWSTWRLAGGLGVRLNPLYFLLPSMLIYGVYNFDLFNALFVVLCLQFFVEKRRGWSAAFMGFAIATKVVAGVLLPVFLFELVDWKDRMNYLIVSLLVAASTLVPIAIFNFGYFSQFLSYYSGWGLEDAWYIWIFGSPFSQPARIFGIILLAVLLARVYTLKMPLIQKSFLALSAYLLSSTIFAPQFTVMLVPIVAVLALNSPWLYSMEVFNSLIILTWFTVPNPTQAWTVPQAAALVRSASLALLALSVAAGSGHSFLGWLRVRLGSQKTLDGFLGEGGPKVAAGSKPRLESQ